MLHLQNVTLSKMLLEILSVELTLTFIRIKTQSYFPRYFHLSNELIEINGRFKMTNNWKKVSRVIFVHRPDETN